ncbi:competence protein ComK [Virgibacillus dakarensis]|nr:competence protein ComK [Virgibacillus dakarensis]
MQVFFRKTPIQLIHIACLDNYASYEGRRKAVMHQTRFKRKVPIPIDP